MYRTLLGQFALVAIAVASQAAPSSSACEVTGGQCLSGAHQTASGIGDHGNNQDLVLMQLRTHTNVMPKVTWSESDPVLDEDFPEDDQPGGQDLTRPAPSPPVNDSQVQVAQVQVHGTPAKSDGPAGK